MSESEGANSSLLLFRRKYTSYNERSDYMELIYLGAFLLMWYGIGKWVLEAVRLVTEGFAHIISSIRGEA